MSKHVLILNEQTAVEFPDEVQALHFLSQWCKSQVSERQREDPSRTSGRHLALEGTVTDICEQYFEQYDESASIIKLLLPSEIELYKEFHQ